MGDRANCPVKQAWERAYELLIDPVDPPTAVELRERVIRLVVDMKHLSDLLELKVALEVTRRYHGERKSLSPAEYKEQAIRFRRVLGLR